MKNKVKKAVLVISIILVPIVIILGCTKLLITNEKFYRSQFTKHGVYDNIGHPTANLALENVFDYFEGYSELNAEVFSESEIAHMRDVKNLMFKETLFFYIIANMLVLSFVSFYFYKKKYIAKSLIYGSVLTLAVILLLFLSALFNFDSFFTGFHKIFFEEGTWTFASDSMLKTLFPDEFFSDFVKTVSVYSSIIALSLLFGLTHKFKKRKKKKKTREKQSFSVSQKPKVSVK